MASIPEHIALEADEAKKADVRQEAGRSTVRPLERRSAQRGRFSSLLEGLPRVMRQKLLVLGVIAATVTPATIMAACSADVGDCIFADENDNCASGDLNTTSSKDGGADGNSPQQNDGGITVNDASSRNTDSGMIPGDASSEEFDGDIAVSDASSEDADSGSQTDAGSEESDSGLPSGDASVDGPDTDASVNDASVDASDAGAPVNDASPGPPEIINGDVTFPAGPGSLTATTVDGGPTAITELRGNLYKPQGDGPFPAVVFMSGCGGSMTGPNNTLGSQFIGWGDRMINRNTVALFVDSMTPRGITEGICDTNGTVISEVEQRPLDAYAGLAYLRTLPYVQGDRIGLVGWSNGASATLASMALQDNVVNPLPAAGGFVMAVAEYPGCGLLSYFGTDHSNPDKLYKSTYLPYAPTWILAGGGDTVVPPSPKCVNLESHADELAGTLGVPAHLNMATYPNAKHSFDMAEAGENNSDGIPWTSDDIFARDEGRTFIEARLDQFLPHP